MATDLKVVLEDRPGTLADLGEALGRAGVNIMGGCGVSCDGQGEIHVLVEDAPAARRALQDAGISVEEETQVLVVPVEDRPGELGGLARMLAGAGINIELLYLTTGGEVVLGVDNLEAARGAL
jgi:hypothetical protein